MDNLITRAAPLERSTLNVAARTVEAILSTGADCPRRDARGAYTERLNLSGVTLPDRLPLLDQHQRGSIAHVLGHADNVRTEAGEIRATLHVADDRALSLIEAGSLTGTSIGYAPASESWTQEAGGRVRSIVPNIHECSLTAFPFDRGAILRREPMEVIDRGEVNAAIRALTRAAELPPAFADGLIDQGATVEAAQAAAFVEMTTRTRVPPALQLAPSGDDQIITRAAAALSADLGAPGELPPEAMQYRGMGLHGICRAILAARGERVMSLSPEGLLLRMVTTGDLPDLLVATGNRMLLATYAAAASPLKMLARQSTAADFRNKTSLRAGITGLLERVAEHGEVRHGGFVETKETYRIDTYGKIWSLTRQALINDDLNAFGDISALMGRQAAETEARLLVNLLTANAGLGPVMDDTITLFDPAHGNEAATGTVIDAAALAAGVLAMRVQKGLSGEPINAVPVYLLVSPQKEHEARQALASFYPATAADVNPLAGSLQILVEPRLTGNRWYLWASPSVLPVLEYSYLSSAPGPQMQSRQGFDVLGIELRTILDYGCGLLDWRGVYTNGGA